MRALAGPSIEFLGRVENEVLWSEYARCRALLFAAEEDFGMVPVEAQACGRPVVAYGKGGALESVAAGREMTLRGYATGVFFHEQTVAAVCDAVLDFEQREQEFDPAVISDWAKRFDSAYFVDSFRELVDVAMASRERDSIVTESRGSTEYRQRLPLSIVRQGAAK